MNVVTIYHNFYFTLFFTNIKRHITDNIRKVLKVNSCGKGSVCLKEMGKDIMRRNVYMIFFEGIRRDNHTFVSLF